MRKPSRTPQECERDLGPRGTLTRLVTVAGPTENRSTMRQWLVAKGFDSRFVCGRAARHMLAVYNDVTDKALGELRQRQQEGESEFPQPAPALEDIPEVPKQIESKPAFLDNPATAIGAAIEVIAAEVAKRTQPQSVSIDEDKVRELIAEKMAEIVAPATTITILNGTTSLTLPAATRHHLFELCLRVLSAGINLALVGGAGGGKSTLCHQLSEALDTDFYLHGAIASSHELTGFVDAGGTYHTSAMREGFEKGGIVALDDFDGSIDAAAPLVVQSALANGVMTFPDNPKPVRKSDKFFCVMSLNTWGHGADRSYVGRTQLDAAFLDRFYFIDFGYDESMEHIAAGGSARARRTCSKIATGQWCGNYPEMKTVFFPECPKRGSWVKRSDSRRA